MGGFLWVSNGYPTGIIADFPYAISLIMEAEQLNFITNKLQDLRTRTRELRRYL